MKSSAYNLSIDRTFRKIWVPFSQEELQKKHFAQNRLSPTATPLYPALFPMNTADSTKSPTPMKNGTFSHWMKQSPTPAWKVLNKRI